MPIKGEYFLTARKPSFCWYGKISFLPGLSVSARDSYQNGKGNMVIKIMSAIKIADVRSETINYSAFGRCVAEMTMIPSFFLDRERIKWTGFDNLSARCIVTDAGLSTPAELYFKEDGSLYKIVVDRYFDRGKNQGTIEKFTGTCDVLKDFNGLRFCV
jgi:hypothetical protein